MRISILILFFSIIFLSQCCDDPICNDPQNPSCPNFDHCIVFNPADASFIILDSITGIDCDDGNGRQDLVFETDTVWTNKDIYFTALNEADSYRWKIGNDPRTFEDKTVSLSFPTTISAADIKVTLISCKTPPEKCSKPICDSLSKNLHVFFTNGTDSTSLVVGQFKGINLDEPIDTFIITIPPPLPSLEGIINFPKDCLNQFLDVRIARYGFILRPTPSVCQSACGVGIIQKDRKTLIINYSVQEGGQRKPKQFIGIKL